MTKAKSRAKGPDAATRATIATLKSVNAELDKATAKAAQPEKLDDLLRALEAIDLLACTRSDGVAGYQDTLTRISERARKARARHDGPAIEWLEVESAVTELDNIRGLLVLVAEGMDQPGISHHPGAAAWAVSQHVAHVHAKLWRLLFSDDVQERGAAS